MFKITNATFSMVSYRSYYSNTNLEQTKNKIIEKL